MTCRELIDFLFGYVEDTLPAVEKEPFEAHLAECPQCVDYVDSYRKTMALGCTVCSEDDVIPPQVPDELVTAILDARRAGKDAPD